MLDRKIRVAVVGMGFGAEFVPIYLHHPCVEHVAICDSDVERLNAVGDKFLVDDRFSSFDDLVASTDFDAVHLVTGIPSHAQQTIAALESGKHCACTVPMATSIDDLKAIVKVQRESGRNYMMMETAVYTRQFLCVKQLFESGAMGNVQFLRGAHYQDMENWPSYWMGLPPMHYATHAISPILALAGTRATKVHCFGSGRMREELTKPYGNPYPVETAIFELDGTDISAEVTRSLFHTAKSYVESFWVLCEDMSFEWGRWESEEPVIYKMEELQSGRGRQVSRDVLEAPDRADLLPPSIGRFTQRGVYDESNPHLSFLQGGGHHGSHPHMVNEFVMSIVEERKPYIDAVTAANWTAPGICAHESAMNGGAEVLIPWFDEENAEC